MTDSPRNKDWSFVNNAQINAPRIQDEVWESHKATILREYKDKGKTLEDVMKYMAQKHGFVATKRQYIHRIGTKWAVKKYKNGESSNRPRKPKRAPSPDNPEDDGSLTPAVKSEEQSFHSIPLPPRGRDKPVVQPCMDQYPIIEPYVLNLDAPNAEIWYRLLADMLAASGDQQSAFQIYAALFRELCRQNSPDLALAHACVSTAQTNTQFKEAQDIIELAANVVQESVAEPGTWDEFFDDALTAHSYDRPENSLNALDQYAEKLIEPNGPIDPRSSEFTKTLKLRSPALDIPLYLHVDYAGLRYNEDDGGDFFTETDPGLDVDKILRQFLDQQPAFADGLLDRPRGEDTQLLSKIPCLRECVGWCIEVLEQTPAIPEDIWTVGINDGDELQTTYKVLCSLWRTWITWIQNPFRYPSTSWSEHTVEQLGIPASSLLTTVVCMIMATNPTVEAGADNYYNAAATIQCIRRKASILNSTDPQTLLRRFLYQVRETSELRMTTTRLNNGPNVPLSTIAPFRKIIASALNLDLPALPEGTIIHPLIFPDLDKPGVAVVEERQRSSSAPEMGLVSHTTYSEPFSSVQWAG
ncbi:hypothetical protein B0H66DRAFT_624042 [Apodospora peruviana]|uniref:Clr5 domain-containing protein n=1 Tax=Apodospora peruviana TaxID=516989 RepID=A0AAE0I6P5_9PEZI|nr:hypothetical protein B0H66DRAFT_624042 [Apodospora peruviana]